MKPIWQYQINPNLVFETYNSAPSFPFLEVKQTHSNIVVAKKEIPCESDGIVSNLENLTALAIKTADCLPIALIGKKQVAMVHAGWRGLQNNILKHDLLIKIVPTIAIIGPAIHSKNYEVGIDVYSQFENTNAFKGNGPKWHLNLNFLAQEQLLKLFPGILVVHSPLDTFKSPNLHSFRRNQTKDRNYNILRIRE